MKNIYILFMILWSFVSLAQQKTMEVTFSDPIPTGTQGEFFIECRVNGFENVKSVLLGWNWEEPTTFIGTDKHAVSNLTVRTSHLGQRLFWNNGGGGGVSLGQGKLLFRIIARSLVPSKPCFFSYSIVDVLDQVFKLENSSLCTPSVRLYESCKQEVDTMTVDIIYDGTEDISSFQFSLGWDKDDYTYLFATNFSNELEGYDSGQISNPQPGEFRTTWNHPIGESTKISRFSNIISIKFLILNMSSSDIIIGNSPLVTEFNSPSVINLTTRTFKCGELDLGTLSGHLIQKTSNCLTVVDSINLKNSEVSFTDTNTGERFYTFTDPFGAYKIILPYGEYKIRSELPSRIWMPCDNNIVEEVNLTSGEKNISLDLYSDIQCPAMKVSISRPFIRRCFDNNYTVEYQNLGTVQAKDAYVEIKLDPFMSYVSSTLPATKIQDRLFRVDLGDVDIFDSKRFKFKVNLDCDSTILGQTHCIEAHIYPDSFCRKPDALWTGGSIETNVSCDGDSVHISITNKGTAETVQLEWIVVEDDIGFMKSRGTFSPLETKEFVFYSTGQTWRVIVEQEPNHPGFSNPTKAIEGCNAENGNFETGFYTAFSEDDENPFIDIDCQESVGSYDPNDKQGYPLGVGDNHGIEPNQKITYTIRFQNTGTDTAFNVVIKDSITDFLDLSTFKVIASSHDVKALWTKGDIMEFHFNNIVLPDSNKNQEASNGFIKYEIYPVSNIEKGDLITNNADIYFDFNSPIRTNTTEHLISPLVITSIDENKAKDNVFTIFPNPSAGGLSVKMVTNETMIQDAVINIYDVDGRRMLLIHSNSKHNKIDVQEWESGLYLITLSQQGKVLESRSFLVIK